MNAESGKDVAGWEVCAASDKCSSPRFVRQNESLCCWVVMRSGKGAGWGGAGGCACACARVLPRESWYPHNKSDNVDKVDYALIGSTRVHRRCGGGQLVEGVGCGGMG